LYFVFPSIDPLHGSTYIPTPQWLTKKKSTVNVKSFDSKCFLWSVLAALHPPKYNPDRLSNYVDYENSLNLTGLAFPLAVKDVPKFEKQNRSISVNVLCRGDEGGYLAIYVTKLKLKIGNPCKNSFATSWIKPTMSATIVTYNFISNTVSF